MQSQILSLPCYCTLCSQQRTWPIRSDHSGTFFNCASCTKWNQCSEPAADKNLWSCFNLSLPGQMSSKASHFPYHLVFKFLFLPDLESNSNRRAIQPPMINILSKPPFQVTTDLSLLYIEQNKAYSSYEIWNIVFWICSFIKAVKNSIGILVLPGAFL